MSDQVMIPQADGSVRVVPVSDAMVRALDLAAKHGDRLHRQSGGYWVGPVNQFVITLTTKYAKTATVRALVDRGIMRWSEWEQNRAGRYPVTAEIIKQ